MPAFVYGYDFKFIVEKLSYHLGVSKAVAITPVLALDKDNERLEHHNEYDGGVVVPSEDPIAEIEGIWLPFLGHDDTLRLWVEMHIVGYITLWDMIVPQIKLNEMIGDWSTGISQIEPGEIHSLHSVLGILDDLTENLNVFNTSIHTLDKKLSG